MTAPETDDTTDLADLFDQLAKANTESGTTTRLAAGTFALYPDRGGAVVLVLNIDEGPEAVRGTMRKRIGPAMIRAMQALGDGGGGIGAIKALMPKRKRRDQDV